MQFGSQVAPAALAGVVEEFLQHLTEEQIISAEQLILSKQALRLWRNPGTGEHEQPIQKRPTDPQASSGRGIFIQGAAGGEQLLQASQAQLPDSPIAESAAKRMPSSSQLPEEQWRAASPAAPSEPVPAAETQPLELLARLPPQLLDHVMTLLAAEPGGSAVRRSCRWLHSAFDRCNTRLGMQSMDQLPDSMRGRLLDLVRRSPALSSLTLGGWQRAVVAWREVLEAGGQQLLQRLERLSLHHDGVSDLGTVAACSRLQRLELESCSHIRDLGPLVSATRLQHLSLQGCGGVHDISPLAACTGLQHLSLGSCTALPDIGPLAACTRLRHLSLDGCDEVQDLSPLAACIGLQCLHMSNCNGISDLSPLTACVRLQRFDLVHCPSVSDVTALASCLALQHLDMSLCGGITGLVACAGLQHFGLTYCRLVHDLSPLAACTGLQHADLFCCDQISSLAPLAACTGLQSLDLSGCRRVRDLSPLAACTGLHRLNLSGCRRVHDLSPLAACTQLRDLDLTGLKSARGVLNPGVQGLSIEVGEYAGDIEEWGDCSDEGMEEGEEQE